MALHILLADDSVPAQNMGKKILTDAGYDVTTVSNGLEALRKIAETVPDLAILDIFMPGYSGLEVCQKLRAGAATAAVPVILTVGKLEPYRVEDGEQVRSNAVIVKPFAASELISAVRSLVGGPPTDVPLHSSAPDPLDHAPSVAPSGFAEPLAAPAHPDAISEPADEPLFSHGAPPAEKTDSLQSKSEGGIYGADSPLGDAEPDHPASLIFDPDAERTPFSASATDFASTFAHEEKSDRVPSSEFDLEPHSIYSSETGLEPAQPPVTAETSSPASVQEMLEPLSTPAAAFATPEAIQAESVPEVDPLLETWRTEIPASILDKSNIEVGEPPMHIVADGFPEEPLAEVEAEPEEPLSAEDEARRKAFEDLFNSSELPPLEESSVAAVALHSDILPSISSKHPEETVEVQPDPELEPLGHDAPSPTLPAEPDPYLLEEEEERSAIGSIPDRDTLLEQSQESVGQVADSSSEELLASYGEEFPVGTLAPLQLETSGSPQVASLDPDDVFALASASEPVTAEEAATEAAQSAPAEVVEHAAPSEQTESPVEPVYTEFAHAELTPAIPEAAGESPETTGPEPAAPPPVPQPEPQVAAASTPEPHVAASSEPAPAEHEESHTILPSFAELATGAGLAAVLPDLGHLVESEVKQALDPHIHPELETHLEQAEAEPAKAEAAASEHIAALAEPASEVNVEPGPAIGQEAATPEALQPEPTSLEPAPTPELEALASAPASIAPSPEAKPVEVHAEAASVTATDPLIHAEADRVHEAVERVFERFKPLLVAAIVRELARHD